jgi:hypothetical protein
MTKHRRTRRKSQRGGDWYNPMSWFGSSESIEVAPSEPGLIDNLSNSVSGAASGAEGFLGSTFEKAKGVSSSWVPDLFSSGETQAPMQAPMQDPMQAIEPAYTQTFGGRRRRRSKARRGLRGGKGGLGLTYYATPVSGIKVAEPTYWIKGGRRRRRTRKTHHKKK